MTTTTKIEIEKARQLLKKHGYFTDNLWHVDDVKSTFKCDNDDIAQSILSKALENSATIEQIWFAIKLEAEEIGLKQIN